MSEPDARMFRSEAVAHYGRGNAHSRVLRLTADGTDLAFHVLIASFAGALAWLALARVHEYASGPVLVRATHRVAVTAVLPGSVERLHVTEGQVVSAGAALVSLHAAQSRAELARTQADFGLQLLRMLQEPGEGGARAAVAALNAQRDLARDQLEQHTLRAPRPGRVADLRVRVGQHIDAGQVMLSLVDGEAAYEAVVLLPGAYRPQLELGVPVRLEWDGYRHAYTHANLASVGDELLGPAEALRQLGTDALAPEGPTVMFKARLPAPGFNARGRALHYFDGMRGRARVRVQSERVLLALFPSLRALPGLGRE